MDMFISFHFFEIKARRVFEKLKAKVFKEISVTTAFKVDSNASQNYHTNFLWRKYLTWTRVQVISFA